MKRYLCVFLSLMSYFTHATIRTVLNSPSNLAQFNTIQAAIDASSSGDTILIHGSPVNYSAFTMTNKRLVLLGPGFNPNVQTSFRVIIGGVVNIIGNASSRSELHGLFFNTSVNFSSASGTLDSLVFFRNIFLGELNMNIATSSMTGFIIRDNYFYNRFNGNGGVFHNLLIENNVFEVAAEALRLLNNAANTNVLINHNLFFTGASSPNNTLQFVSFCLFTNNIFVENALASGPSQCTFINNITFTCTPNNPWSINSNINGGGNVEDMDPQMVDQAAVNSGAAFELSDFTIAAGPANNSGTDGQDMGLLYNSTGGLNWAHSRNSRLPSIVTMNMANPVIGSGGTLNLTIDARKNE